MRIALPVALIALVVAGCGNSGGSAPSTTSASRDSPKAAVQAFIDAVGKGDWKTVCSRLANEGQAELTTELDVAQHAFVPPSERDQFGQWKDCAATLGKRASAVSAVFKGAGPATSAQGRTSKTAVVTTPQGSWAVTIESPSKLWRVAGFPRSKP